MQAPDAHETRFAGLRHWLGLGLPPRTIELRFDLPRRRRRGRRPPLTPEGAQAALSRNDAKPGDCLAELVDIIIRLNRCPLSPKDRMALLESLARCSMPPRPRPLCA